MWGIWFGYGLSVCIKVDMLGIWLFVCVGVLGKDVFKK